MKRLSIRSILNIINYVLCDSMCRMDPMRIFASLLKKKFSNNFISGMASTNSTDRMLDLKFFNYTSSNVICAATIPVVWLLAAITHLLFPSVGFMFLTVLLYCIFMLPITRMTRKEISERYIYVFERRYKKLYIHKWWKVVFIIIAVDVLVLIISISLMKYF